MDIHNRFEEFQQAGNLPSPAGIGLAILRQTQREDGSIDELLECVRSDPALTGRLLRLANASRGAASDPATSVETAARRVGPSAVRNLALGFTLVPSNRSGRCASFDFARFWSFSLACAIASESLAIASGRADSAQAFTCGLLSRIGMLALACVHPEAYSKVLDECVGLTRAKLLAAEQRVFEINHWEVTVSMLGEWGLPELFGHALRACSQDEDKIEQPLDDPNVRALASILSAGSRIAELVRTGALCEATRSYLENSSFIALGEDLGLDVRLAVLVPRAEERRREANDWPRLALPAERCDGGDDGNALSIPANEAPAWTSAMCARTGTAPPKSSAKARPRCATAPCRRPAKPSRSRPKRSGEPGRLDDDPKPAPACRAPEAGRHQVRTGGKRRRRLQIVLDESPHIIVTDWTMPELSGLDLCKALRRMEAGRRTYVLILTAREDEDRIIDAFNAGADDYVTKPFNPRILLARVQAGQRLIELQRRVDIDKSMQMKQVAAMGLMTRKLRAAALTDVLTELPNRRFAMTRLAAEWNNATRTGRPLAVVMIDIDHFKRINDDYGHDVGDYVLKQTAAVLRARTRHGDVVCRLGGEEFLLVIKVKGRNPVPL